MSYFRIKKRVYIAGGLFNVAERAHNSRLESSLIETAKKSGIELKTTLPQRTALKRYLTEENRFDVAGIVSDCEMDAATHDYILCNVDGTDADSGTAVELGIARGQRIAYQRFLQLGQTDMAKGIVIPKIIAYRTDFRTSIEHEVGLNAMLNPEDATFIYHPCFAIEENEIAEYYETLALKITEVMKNAA